MLVMLVCSGFAAWVARGALRPWLDAGPYRALWMALLALTAALFALTNPALLMAAVLVVAFLTPNALGLGAAGAVGLYLALAVAMPPVTLTLASLIEITVPRAVALVALLPLALRLAQARPQQGVAPIDWWLVDLMVVGYEALAISSQWGIASSTHLVRMTVLSMLDTLLPYYVITRGIIGMQQVRAVMAVFVATMVLVCVATYVEQLLRWPMYSDLQWSYNQRWISTWILVRGTMLRVRAMTPQPILLGYVVLFGMGYWMALAGTRWRERQNLLVTAGLVVALYFTVSRGPMMGGVLFLISLLLLLKMPPARYGWLLAVSAVGLSSAVIMGWDEALVDAVKQLWGEPASAGDSSIDYRKALLDTARALVRDNPWFGVPNYYAHMEHLRQGEGIVDLVNTYLYIALAYGLVGLTLFVMPFVIVVRRMLRRLALTQGDDAMMARALISLIVAALFVLFTTSSWWVMPQLNVTLIALCLAYVRLPIEAPPADVAPPHELDQPWQPQDAVLEIPEQR